MLKRFFAIVCTVCLLAACSQGQNAAESGEAKKGTVLDPRNLASSEASSQAKLPNPIVAYETPDFTDAAGFAVSEYPEGDGLTLSRCALIAGEVAELEFALDEGELTATLRVAPEKGQDISGVYGQRYEQSLLQETDGIVLENNASAGGPYLVRWSKDGYAFTLWMEQAPMGVFGGILPRFLAVEVTPGREADAPVAAAAPGFSVVLSPGQAQSPALTLEGVSELPARCWVIGETVAQYDWEEIFGAPAILRVAEEGAGQIDGCYYPVPTAGYGDTSRSETIDGVEVTLRDCESGNFRADWVKDGIRFHLWLPAYDQQALQGFLQSSVLTAGTIVD